jgi:preprotein translocase subunit SecG
MFLADTKTWYLERIIWMIAGAFILISLGLSRIHSEYWLILTALVGINLTILSLTGFCPMTVILNKLGVKSKTKS